MAEDPYAAIVSMLIDYWSPPGHFRGGLFRARTRDEDWSHPDSRVERFFREHGLWAHWGTGTVDGLKDRIRAEVPVWVFLQSLPFDRSTLYPALVVGMDEERDLWLLYGVGDEPLEYPFDALRREWYEARYRWVLVAPPDRTFWSMSAAERRSRGRYWMAVEQYERAALDFGAALEQAPQEPAHYIELADSYLMREQYTVAEPLYRAALSLDELNARGMNNLSYTLIHADGDMEEAIALARNATALEPDNPRLLDTLGVALHRAGRLNEAARVLQRARTRAMSMAPDVQTAIILHLVQVYHDNQQGHLARQALADALALDPALAVPPALRRHIRTDQKITR